MARSMVAVNAQGRLTLPAHVRRKLGIAEGSQLEVALDDDRIILRPATVVVSQDTWAYTRKHLDSVRRALEDVRAGRTYLLTEAQLLRGEDGRKRDRSRKQARP